MDVRAVDGESRRALREWVVRRFTPGELQMLVRDLQGDAVDLPVGSMTEHEYAFAVLDGLERRGLIDAGFFDTLAQLRPALTAEIAALRGPWQVDVPSAAGMSATVKFEGPRGAAASALRDFTGRAGPLVDLERLLQANATVCVVASGIGGIGKTTLVHEFVARRAPACFPEGSAWLDGQALTDELARVARRFGWRGARDPTPAEATALLQGALWGRRFLLVVDNVDADADPTLVPVPGGSCRTVVTSRRTTMHLDLDNAASLELELWSEGECLEFLGSEGVRRGHDAEEDLRALAEFVGHLPLGVRLVGLMLRKRPGTTAATVLEELRRRPLVTLERHRGKNPGLAATFQATWDALNEHEKRVLHALAACANGTRTDIVEAVAGVDDDVSSTLDDLTTRSLVQCAPTSESPWGLHDVVRMFVVEQDGFDERAEVHHTWVRTCMDKYADPLTHAELSKCVAEARQAFSQLIRRGDRAGALRLYSPLRKHLLQIWQLPTVIMLAKMLLLTGSSNSADEAMCLGDLGLCYRRLGDVQGAITYHERAAAAYENLGQVKEQALQLGNLALCHITRGEERTAIGYLERALAFFETHGDLEGQSNCLGNLGACYRRLDQVPTAIEYHERSLAIEEKLGRLEGQAKDLGNLGMCYRRLGDVPRAIHFHERSLSIEERLGNAEGQASELGNLALCYHQLGDSRRAGDLQTRAIGLFRRAGLSDAHPSMRTAHDNLVRFG
ncbi:tetratricopeptide repeat protein [Nannocystis sp. ILAH1]|uniref:tetratricopeptide repeat protein n=1 Tax=Nannocystis sp. ILAH1 TaxID=2996789 RepID=UPI00226E23EF|nr:tetratricopeptide repeat protein [Nannocystis sp. ILAH1]MCY0992129.1 tetratricopeptide repeat protein [Nannocystis sp. ILAH1]